MNYVEIEGTCFGNYSKDMVAKLDILDIQYFNA